SPLDACPATPSALLEKLNEPRGRRRRLLHRDIHEFDEGVIETVNVQFTGFGSTGEHSIKNVGGFDDARVFGSEVESFAEQLVESHHVWVIEIAMLAFHHVVDLVWHLGRDHDPRIAFTLNVPLIDTKTTQPLEVSDDALGEGERVTGGKLREPG